MPHTPSFNTLSRAQQEDAFVTMERDRDALLEAAKAARDWLRDPEMTGWHQRLHGRREIHDTLHAAIAQAEAIVPAVPGGERHRDPH